jgi:hypothetical protein
MLKEVDLIASGDLSSRLEKHGNDELSQLADHINEMAEEGTCRQFLVPLQLEGNLAPKNEITVANWCGACWKYLTVDEYNYSHTHHKGHLSGPRCKSCGEKAMAKK